MTLRNPLVLVSGSMRELPAGDTVAGASGAGGPGAGVVKFNVVGYVVAGLLTPRWYPERDMTLTGAYFSLGTAGSAQFDVRKNGASVFPGAKPTTANANKSTVVALNISLTPTDYLTVAVVAAGGADATLCITYT